MKSDIDAVMKSRNLDALIVFGNAEHNPPMYYLTGGGHVSHATVIKKRGEEAIFFFGDMERDEAISSLLGGCFAKALAATFDILLSTLMHYSTQPTARLPVRAKRCAGQAEFYRSQSAQ